MKKLTLLFLASTCMCFLSLSGCGGGEAQVIEAPAATGSEEEDAMEGMSDEEYDKAMDADMN